MTDKAVETVVGAVAGPVAGAVAGPAFGAVFRSLKLQVDYVADYRVNCGKLKTVFEKLKESKDAMERNISESRRNGKGIVFSVLKWVIGVEKILADAKELIDSDDHKKAEQRRNPGIRYNLGKEVYEMIQTILKALEGGKFERISYDVGPSNVTFSPSSRCYVFLDSRTKILNEIMMELNNPKFFIIGVHGAGGVGKTKLMEQVAWETETNSSFDPSLDAVVMATITDSPDVNNIQTQTADVESIKTQIAACLGMEFTSENRAKRARDLRDRIKAKRHILVILDGIWSKFNLTDVGIPSGKEGCKLVMIARDLNVLNACDFPPHKAFRLEALNDDDSWKLFEKMAGDVVQESKIKPIAADVAKWCAGLPLLMDHVAKCLIKKIKPDNAHVESIWEDALNQLKEFKAQGLHKKVSSTVELSYNWLESEEQKLLFLFISSFGLDYLNTGPLFICSWGLGLFTDCHSLAEARVRFDTLINNLKASSLLLESEIERVRIHDLTRGAGKSIASRKRPTYAVKRYTEMKEWPKMDEPEKLVQIILPWSYIYKLPKKLECPDDLELLQLQNIGDYLEVPDDFFSEMIKLKVISLYGMMFTSSSLSSLKSLTELKTLVLSGCVLEDISIVAKLKSLEILRLERSDIKELPKELGKLTNLRMLNLTNCSALSSIPPDLISSLTSLEELYMGNCFIKWHVEGRKGQSNNASLEELRKLSHLTALDIMIQDASVWPRDLLDNQKLKRYNIFVGDKWKWSLDWSGNASKPSKMLKLEGNKSSSFLVDRGIKSLLNSAEDMCLSNIHGVDNVLYKLNGKGFPQLEHLNIQDCTELKYIIKSEERPTDPALPKLETFTLQNLPNLDQICYRPIDKVKDFYSPSFTKLRSFEVKGCNQLRNLLWWCYPSRDLPQLREIKVSDCQTITDIFVVETSTIGEKIIFPELRSLELQSLPKLNNLCSTTKQYTPTALIYSQVEMPRLELLKLSDISSKKLWDDNAYPHSCIQNVKRLTIDKCSEVAYAFSFKVAKGLENLTHLKISNCQMLEIFFSDGKSSSPVSDDQVIFPNLETFEISDMKLLNSVWHDQLPPKSFCKLKQLKIKSCSKLLNVFPSCVLDKLQKLETVTVTDCPALKVVFEIQGLKADGGRQIRLDMQLKTLSLENLPMLQHIWSGNPNESFKFQNICLLKVTKCEILNHVLPLSMAKKLQRIQEIYIAECGIEMFAAPAESLDKDLILRFPELTSLSFRHLKQLQSFYSGSHTLDCPVLRHADVLHCDKLSLFKPRSPNRQEDSDETPYLLSIEQFVPNTRELILNSNDVTMLLSDKLIYRVTALRLRCYHDKSVKFPLDSLQGFTNPIKLKVTCSFFTHIFSSGSAGHSKTTMKLKSLELIKLPNLKIICEEESEVKIFIQNIETLVVSRCPELENIVPSSVFENLEQLEVQFCDGVEYIMKSSTVANLPKLWKLCVDGCGKIEEIVASDNEEDASVLCFMKLRYLRLNKLPKLRSFCKGKYGFKFPLLKTLFVINCPNMKIFSHGVLNTPKLTEILVSPGYESEWNGGINSTLEKIAAKKNSG